MVRKFAAFTLAIALSVQPATAEVGDKYDRDQKIWEDTVDGAKDPSQSQREGSGGFGSALGAVIGVLAIYYLGKTINNSANEKEQITVARNYGRNLVDTTGDWYVVNVDREKNLNVFSKPSWYKNGNSMLAILPSDTKNINLAGACTGEFCPIILKTSYNDGVGWVSQENVARRSYGYAETPKPLAPPRPSMPDTVPTNGFWRVKAGGLARLKAGPNSDARQVAAFSDRTQRIRLTGNCQGKMCPVTVYGDTNNMAGWMDRYRIERNY